MKPSLYVVSWREPGREWCIASTERSLRAARKVSEALLQNLVLAPELTVRIQRWVRPGSVGTHGWLTERRPT